MPKALLDRITIAGDSDMRLTSKARRAGYAVAALGCALTATVTAPSAANASAGAYCGTYGNGYTSQTVFTKQPPGCVDFNLTWTKHDGWYKGHYWDPGYGWRGCDGQVWHWGGENYRQTLCSNVVTGTLLYVEKVDSTTVGWNVWVNY